MRSFCARTSVCAKRTAFSGFEPERKTVRGTGFPANVGGAKKSCDVLRGTKAVRFQYIADYRGTLTRSHLCRLMGVSEHGLHAWKHRPPSHRQRRDMVLLAHIRDQQRLSLGSYGRPRMTEELNELGLRVGQRRVSRLMRGMASRSSAAGSSSAPPTAITGSISRRTCCNRISLRARQTRNGQLTSPMSGRGRAV